MSEEIRASHILVESKEDAQKIYEDIKNGVISFEEAAMENSICPSGQVGGDLGYFGKGLMVKPFEDAAFALEKDVVSDPVQTQFGWHLIKVTEK